VELHKQSDGEELQEAIRKADQEMYDSGIVAVGDICNTNFSFSVKGKSSIFYHSFIEVYGFHPDRAELVFDKALSLAKELRNLHHKNCDSISLVPHAPYSVSDKLFSLLENYSKVQDGPFCIHSQESEDENLLFMNKSGKILERLQHFGINTDFFEPTNQTSIKSILHKLPLDRSLLFVHNTYSNQCDIDFIIENYLQSYFCFCPRANYFIERRFPDFLIFSKLKDRLCLGTDSLASNYSLNFGEEIGFLHLRHPEISLEEILRWSTSNGARFLGVTDWCGSFIKGKLVGLTLLQEAEGKYFSQKVV
jgi:aminodeoxyfutalosine deaminase